MSYDISAAPLLLCRTGSMTLFDGDLATWSGGHRHPNKTGEAGEAWNWTRTPGGYVYGYVQNGWGRSLNINRLGALKNADRVEGVTVAWCSRDPTTRKLVIHGWYENAVVFRSAFLRPDGKGFKGWAVAAYFQTDGDSAHLLPPDQRKYSVPYGEKGTIGHTDILYVDEVNKQLAAAIRRYIAKVRNRARLPAPVPGTPPDHRGWGGGESAQHLALKLYVRDHPSCLELGIRKKGQEEYVLPSLDGVDVVFEGKDAIYAVEVKPRGCGESEHFRGLYQCVKYRALLEAQRLEAKAPVLCTPVLVTEDALSNNHAQIAKLFGIIHRQIRVTPATALL